VCGCGCQ